METNEIKKIRKLKGMNKFLFKVKIDSLGINRYLFAKSISKALSQAIRLQRREK